jgi:hypothetical protein
LCSFDGYRYRRWIIEPQGTSIGRRSPRVSRIPYKSGQFFSHYIFRDFYV